jgi:DNA helicase HerA-like ATPase
MHTLIIGRTLSGKTTWAKKKAASLKKLGYKIIVLDPFLDPAWNADFITSDKDKFLSTVWNSRQCAVFVDEAGDMVGKYDTVMNELATRGRHWGHKCYFITQRAKQLSTTVRAQCSELVIFKQSQNDTKDLANEFVDNTINEAHTLSKGQFIYVRDGHETIKLNVFDL